MNDTALKREIKPGTYITSPTFGDRHLVHAVTTLPDGTVEVVTVGGPTFYFHGESNE